MSYYPVTIQRQDPETEEWADWGKFHAIRVNRAGGGEAYSAGRAAFRLRLAFDFRWCRQLDELRWELAAHRIVYQGRPFNLQDYDDYMEQHLRVRLTGEAYG